MLEQVSNIWESSPNFLKALIIITIIASAITLIVKFPEPRDRIIQLIGLVLGYIIAFILYSLDVIFGVWLIGVLFMIPISILIKVAELGIYHDTVFMWIITIVVGRGMCSCNIRSYFFFISIVI